MEMLLRLKNIARKNENPKYLSGKRIAIYGRTSNTSHELRLMERIEKLKNYAESKDCIIIDTYIDSGYKGNTVDRPSLQRLIQDVNVQEVDIIIIGTMQEWSSSMKCCLELYSLMKEKQDIGLVFVNDQIEIISTEEIELFKKYLQDESTFTKEYSVSCVNDAMQRFVNE